MVNRGEEEVWVQMNVVPRSTGNTNSGTREFYQIITYIRVPMRCARTAVGQCMIVRRGFGCVVKSSSTLVFFNRFCHGKFTCLFNLFLLVRGRVPRSLFRFYGLNFSVVVTCHCAQPNDFRTCPGSCFLSV